MTATSIKIAVTLTAIALAVVHLYFPNLTLDAFTLTLIGIAIVPWLVPLVKSLETPSGWKVEFQELENASIRAAKAGMLEEEEGLSEEEYSFQFAARRDPNLALAGLRIEIESRLVKLGRAFSVLPNNRPMGIGELLRILTKHDILKDEERSILSDMIHHLNAAAHGATVEFKSAEWAIDVGPRLLASLENRVREAPLQDEDQDLLNRIKNADYHPYYTSRSASVERLLNAQALTYGQSSEGWFVRLTDRGKELAERRS